MAAICLLANPLLSVLSLAFMLAIFLLVEGILEFALYFRLRRFHHSIWLLIDGVSTLILGILGQQVATSFSGDNRSVHRC
jgi:uncharacterized membrane protein HdeD (DUF308 family)